MSARTNDRNDGKMADAFGWNKDKGLLLRTRMASRGRLPLHIKRRYSDPDSTRKIETISLLSWRRPLPESYTADQWRCLEASDVLDE